MNTKTKKILKITGITVLAIVPFGFWFFGGSIIIKKLIDKHKNKKK